MMKEKTPSFEDRVEEDRLREHSMRWSYKYMPYGVKRREQIRRVLLRYGYIYVNRKHTLSVKDPDIRHLLRKNVVKTKRVTDTGPMCRNTLLVLVNKPSLPVYS